MFTPFFKWMVILHPSWFSTCNTWLLLKSSYPLSKHQWFVIWHCHHSSLLEYYKLLLSNIVGHPWELVIWHMLLLSSFSLTVSLPVILSLECGLMKSYFLLNYFFSWYLLVWSILNTYSEYPILSVALFTWATTLHWWYITVAIDSRFLVIVLTVCLLIEYFWSTVTALWMPPNIYLSACTCQCWSNYVWNTWSQEDLSSCHYYYCQWWFWSCGWT